MTLAKPNIEILERLEAVLRFAEILRFFREKIWGLEAPNNVIDQEKLANSYGGIRASAFGEKINRKSQENFL